MTNLTGRITAGNHGKLTGTMSGAGSMSGTISMQRAQTVRGQSKTVVPTDAEQTIHPDPGYTGLDSVTVAPIPANYGRISYDGVRLTVE